MVYFINLFIFTASKEKQINCKDVFVAPQRIYTPLNSNQKSNIYNTYIMETNSMTPEKSLQIISEAIAKSRRDFEKNAGSPLVTWGTIVFLFSILVWFMLRETNDGNWNFLWFGIPVLGWPLTQAKMRREQSEGSSSFISKMLGYIWIVYGIFATSLATAFAFIAPEYSGFLTAVLLGFAATMTGVILKNTYITIGGILTGIGCTIALFYIEKWDAALLFAVAAVLNLIIPGYIMNKKAK